MIGNRIRYCVFALFCVTVQVKSQICLDIPQYGRCSANSACGCFHMINTDNTGVCGFLWPTCSQLVPCNSSTQACHESDTICVRHPNCRDHSVCYPVSMIDQRVCPSLTITSTIVTLTTTSATTITTTQRSTETTTMELYTPSTDFCSSTVATPCKTTTSVVANCQSYEVSWNNHCYYLDGSAGSCAPGYSLASNAVLGCIATQFTGKTYRHAISNNCCIWTTDKYTCYGLDSTCNKAGPFVSGPTFNGGWCANKTMTNHHSRQLTFCGSI